MSLKQSQSSISSLCAQRFTGGMGTPLILVSFFCQITSTTRTDTANMGRRNRSGYYYPWYSRAAEPEICSDSPAASASASADTSAPSTEEPKGESTANPPEAEPELTIIEGPPDIYVELVRVGKPEAFTLSEPLTYSEQRVLSSLVDTLNATSRRPTLVISLGGDPPICVKERLVQE